MEKLIALALLYFSGFDVWDDFSAQADKLFLSEPDNEDLIYIEFAADKKDAVIHAVSLIETDTGDLQIDTYDFGKELMALLETEFNKNELSLSAFSHRTMEIWGCFPWDIAYKEPFISLDYAGDPLGYGNEKLCKEIFQKAFDFYKDI